MVREIVTARSDLVDKVALAIMDANSVPTAENVWEVYREMARAAISVMHTEGDND